MVALIAIMLPVLQLQNKKQILQAPTLTQRTTQKDSPIAGGQSLLMILNHLNNLKNIALLVSTCYVWIIAETSAQ